MEINVTWHGDNFNVDLSSKEGAEAFLSIKGCRIVDGPKGSFVSYPARKQDNGKWWNHVWGSERFSAEVLRKAEQSRPEQRRPAPRRDAPEDDIPFADPLRGRKGLAL